MSAEPVNHFEKHGSYPVKITLQLKWIFWVSIIVVIVISVLDITGWITGIDWLKSMGKHWAPMKVISSLCFVITSMALVIILTKRPSAIKTTGPFIIGVFLILVSLPTSFSWLYSLITGNEALLSSMPVLNLFLSPVTRMALLSSFIFFLTGITLILLARDNSDASDFAHILFFPASIASYMIPVSYILDVNSSRMFFNIPVALNSGIAFCAVCVAVFVVRSDTWLLKVFTSRETGGIISRRLLPWLLLLPVIIGWLGIKGEQSGLFVSEFGVMLVAITYTFGLILLIWFTARSVNLIDRRRQIADEALKKSNEELEEKIRERTSELLSLNKVLDEEIKERIEAEKSVEAERQRVNNLLELIPAYIILLTPDYHVSYSNRYFRERFGSSRASRCFEFLFDRSEPYEVCETYRTLRENRPITWEWTGPDGHIYSIHDFPYTDSDGSPLIMEMGIDVTDLKQAEKNLVTLNAELEQRIRLRTSELLHANERLDILSETSSRLLASDEPHMLINSLCNRVMKFLDCQIFFNFLMDEKKGKLKLNAYAGIDDKIAREIEWIDAGVTVCGCVARDGNRFVAENIFETPDPRTELVKSLGIRAYACHHLKSKDKVIGTLSFGTESRTAFNDEDMSMMMTVADQVSIALTRVRNEESLRRNEERYKSLMELSPGASFVNRNDQIVLLNSAARKLLGVNTAEEILGKSPYDLFHPDHHEKIRARMDKIMKGLSVPMSIEQIIRADGVIRDVEVVAAGITDSEGPAIQVIMNDITERKLAEKELFDTKNYLENLIDNANAPIIVWDQQNKIRLFNHAFERLTGYSSSEVAGKKLDKLFPKDTLEESLTKIKRAKTENWETIEIPILTKKKKIRTVLWNSAKIFDTSRKTFSTIAQGNDITERIEAERAFKASKEKLDIALENGNIGTWELEISTGKFNWDGRIERMFGQKPGTFRNSYEAFEKCIHEEDLMHVRNAFSKALNEDSPLDTIFRIRHNTNDINYISTKALVEKDKEGNPKKISGVCFDITEMKMGAEKVLFQLNEELLRSNKELEQFAYVASHDLQEPLRMVSSFTQLLAQRYKDKLDNNAQEFIQFAVEGASRMQVMINDLLDYSRIGTRGKEFSNVDIHDVLGRVVSNLQLKIQEKNALITNDEVPVIVADEGQMIQLFQNLIWNALKFCKTSPRIHISAKEGQNNYLFSVKDNGIGIETQYFERIFQIFQRLHPKDQYGGTGIGLPICKRIVDRHGGEIWVESKPGKGSVFYFTILKRDKS